MLRSPKTFWNVVAHARLVLLVTAIGAAAGAGVLLDQRAIDRPDGASVGVRVLRPRPPVIKPERTVIDPQIHEQHVILVKFTDDLPIRERGGRLTPGKNPPAQPDPQELFREYPQLTAINAVNAGHWTRMTAGVSDEVNDAMRATAQHNLARAVADMNTYFHLFLPDGADAAEVIDALNALEMVELAEPAYRPPPPPLPPNFQPNQGYLNAATIGIDAYFAWDELGTRGEGIRIVDIEYTFNSSHQDLPNVTVIGPTPQDPGFGPEHGTAVLGQLGSVNNGWGTTGIAHESELIFRGAYTGGVWNVAGAITNASSYVEPGDVILIEQQVPGPNGGSLYVPVEWHANIYNAIVIAVGNGRVMVVAAGNGGENLDATIFSQGNNGHWPFLPQNDSGSIIVGAGHAPAAFGGSGTDRSRMSFSTYGSRVNVQGWGERVSTTGYGWAYSSEGPNLYYTHDFGGTSSASPIVAGACALLQSVVKSEYGLPVSPLVLRDVLMQTGSPQQSGLNPASQNIGPRPNVLVAAYELLDLGPPPPPPPSNDTCTASLAVQSGLTGFSNLSASTSGPDEPNLCLFDGDSQVRSDVWFRHTATCTGELRVSLCEIDGGQSDFDAKIAIYGHTCPTIPNGAHACNRGGCADASEGTYAVRNVTIGQTVRIRIGGHEGAQGNGVMAISCTVPSEPEPCPPDINGDTFVDGFDLLILLGNWGAVPGGHPADFDGNGNVDGFDLLILLGNWGPCA